MSPTWLLFIISLTQMAMKYPPPVIACTECGEKDLCEKHGSYSRYALDGESLINIPRFKCHNDSCPRVTFSLLPYPMLRYVRASLCMFYQVLLMYEQGTPIHEIAAFTGNSWAVTRRWIDRAKEIQGWLKKTASYVPWRGDICRLGKDTWHEFIPQFSWHFYPARYGKISPTEL
ncbi:MAG: hypothetical protein HQK66_14050 [Desulfamplus sp.]|nr:hypothetical protein [Desulfamplus sp.]